MSDTNQRRWQRVGIDKAVVLTAKGAPMKGTASDISAGGASITGFVEELDDDVIELAIDDFGEFDAAVVRRWDDGVAVTFDLNEDEQYSLQEELEVFRRENDLEWD